jgi:acetoacetate decarboxylase
MGKRGRLSLEKCGYAMPADAPAYHKPPFYYRDSRCIAVAFETDPETALEVLPEPLSLVDPATAVLSFYDYRWSTFGRYQEAILSLLVEHQGRYMTYIQQIAVTTEPPMLGGREIWGFPKKLAKITFESERDLMFGVLERPAGIRLASAIVRPETPGSPSAPILPVSLRLIPAPERNAERPSCAELIEAEIEQRVIETWAGTGSASFAECSALDPWDRFPARRVLSASYTVFDMTLGFGKVIDRLR